MTLNTVTLTLDLFDGADQVLEGVRALVFPNVPVTDSGGHVVITKSPVTVMFPDNGTVAPTIELVATDNTDLSPAGWAWTIYPPSISGIAPFSFFLNFSDGASQFLSAQVPATPPPKLGVSLPLPLGSAAAGQVPVATGDGSVTSWGSPSSGSVASVNGQTGTVVLGAADVGAATTGALTTETARAEAAEAATAATTPSSLPVPVAQGGTGSITAPSALTALGAAAASGLTAEISRAEAAEATALLISNNLSELTASAATARTNLGAAAAADLTTETSRATTAEGLAALKANNLSDLASAATARTNLGLTVAATVTLPLSIANGGTGQATQQAAIDALTVASGSSLGQVLRSNGTHAVLAAIQASDVPTLNQGTTGTAANITGTLDGVPAPAANVAMAGHKLTGLANGSASGDSAAFGQIPLIDATAGDIAASPATAEAGGTGKTADAAHVHPQPPMFAPTGLTGATSASRYIGAVASGIPLSGTFVTGDWGINQTGQMIICTAGGTPGTWVKLGQLDTTATDIVALGAQAAGATGKTADAGHVHPNTGLVTGVTAADTSVVVGGTSQAPTIRTNTLDVIAAQHAAAADWSNNSHKITSLLNGSAAQDAAAFGQIPLIDATATDIALGGTQAAGAVGKAADAGHVHPAQGLWLPSDQGLLTANYPLHDANNTTVFVTGTVYVMKIFIRKAITITNLWFAISTAGAGAQTTNFCGLYSSAGVLLSGSADIGSQLRTAGGTACPLTTPQALAAGTFVWAAVLSNLATTIPIPNRSIGVTAANMNLTAANFAFGQIGTAQTSLPGSFTPSALSQASAITYWVGAN